MNDRFSRTKSLIGSDSLEKLKQTRVAVFGIGGVGSYAAEALARSGIGTLYLYDSDKVDITNLNRQLIATESSVGEFKTKVAAKRYKDINPQIRIIENPVFVTDQTAIPFSEFDFIIDAIDNVSAKLYLAESAQKNNIPIISIMGTGNKLDPSRLKISDIFETKECPLCRVMRYELKKRNINSLLTVWSDERPIKPMEQTEIRESGRPSPASMAFVPGSAGLLAASYVIRYFTHKESARKQ